MRPPLPTTGFKVSLELSGRFFIAQRVGVDETVLSSVRKLVKLAPRLARTRWMRRPSGIDDWADDSGRVVIMGEAAHPWFVSNTSKTRYRELTSQ